MVCGTGESISGVARTSVLYYLSWAARSSRQILSGFGTWETHNLQKALPTSSSASFFYHFLVHMFCCRPAPRRWGPGGSPWTAGV
eukprot:4671154-Amphidinium_carterae.1